MEYSGAGVKLIHEKNQKQKISWHCPFNVQKSETEESLQKVNKRTFMKLPLKNN